jgi:hypothetical protein
VMDEIVGNLSQELQGHLQNYGVSKSMFLPSWIMTVFAADFHPSVTGRLLDIMLVVGWREPIVRVATALIAVAEEWLLQVHKMEGIVDVLKVLACTPLRRVTSTKMDIMPPMCRIRCLHCRSRPCTR